MKWSPLLPVLGMMLAGVQCPAQGNDLSIDPNREITFEQHIQKSVDSRLEFTDESGQSVFLGNFYHQRPIILAMGYYQCPMLCGVVLNALVRSLQDISPDSPNRDFNFIFVSIDPNETAGLAGAKRQNYLNRYGWSPASDRWHFLTGSKNAIGQLAEQVGFRFRYDAATRQFVHPSGLVFLTPNGKISSYLLGIEYPPKELARAITEAREERVGSPVQQVLLLCFSGNAAPGSIGASVLLALRLSAIITLVGLVVLIRSSRRKVKRRPTS